MRFCNIVTLAVGLAHGINARPMGADFDHPEAENHCFARCMSSQRQCREVPGASLSRCASEFAICKPTCPEKPTYSTSTPTSISTSTCTTSTPTSTAIPAIQCVGSACLQFTTVATATPSVTVRPGVHDSCYDQCQAINAKCLAGQGDNVAKCESNLRGCTWLCPMDGFQWE